MKNIADVIAPIIKELLEELEIFKNNLSSDISKNFFNKIIRLFKSPSWSNLVDAVRKTGNSKSIGVIGMLAGGHAHALLYELTNVFAKEEYEPILKLAHISPITIKIYKPRPPKRLKLIKTNIPEYKSNLDDLSLLKSLANRIELSVAEQFELLKIIVKLVNKHYKDLLNTIGEYIKPIDSKNENSLIKNVPSLKEAPTKIKTYFCEEGLPGTVTKFRIISTKFQSEVEHHNDKFLSITKQLTNRLILILKSPEIESLLCALELGSPLLLHLSISDNQALIDKTFTKREQKRILGLFSSETFATSRKLLGLPAIDELRLANIINSLMPLIMEMVKLFYNELGRIDESNLFHQQALLKLPQKEIIEGQLNNVAKDLAKTCDDSSTKLFSFYQENKSNIHKGITGVTILLAICGIYKACSSSSQPTTPSSINNIPSTALKR